MLERRTSYRRGIRRIGSVDVAVDPGRFRRKNACRDSRNMWYR
jgi:hypothetical protein